MTIIWMLIDARLCRSLVPEQLLTECNAHPGASRVFNVSFRLGALARPLFMTSSAASIFVSFSSLRNMHKHMHAEAQHTQALVPLHQHKESAGSTDGWAGLGPSSQGKNNQPARLHPSILCPSPAGLQPRFKAAARTHVSAREGPFAPSVWSPQQAGALTLRHDP